MAATSIPELPYDCYRFDCLNGDLLLWKPRDAIGEVIARATQGLYCHASGVVHVLGRPFQSAYREGQHGFLSPLSAEIRRNSGSIVVFRIAGLEPAQRGSIAWHLVEDLGGDYAWTNLASIATELTWTGRLASVIPWIGQAHARRVEAASRRRSSAICSQHFARAVKAGAGLELCPGIPLPLVSPNDLARSADVRLLGRLTWPSHWRSG